MLRRTEYAAHNDDARALLAAADTFTVAGVGDDGAVVLRTLHGVVMGDALYFHASPKGEKRQLDGGDVVIACSVDLARLPSHFFDAEKACPATTLYQSVQLRGRLRTVHDLDEKARVLQALMEKLQPEGGHAPIVADDDRYRAAVKGLWAGAIDLGALVGKFKLAQNKRPEEREALLTSLWRRGDAGDVEAIEHLRRANADCGDPAFLRSPVAGVRLQVAMGTGTVARVDDVVAQVVALLRGAYWNDQFGDDDIARAHRGSQAWVGATDDAGVVIATARAISDGGKYAWIYDVMVAEPWRGKGLGGALVRLLVDHPAVRGARRMCLGTKDAHAVYRPFGFVDVAALPPRPYLSTMMVRVRPRLEPLAKTT